MDRSKGKRAVEAVENLCPTSKSLNFFTAIFTRERVLGEHDGDRPMAALSIKLDLSQSYQP